MAHRHLLASVSVLATLLAVPSLGAELNSGAPATHPLSTPGTWTGFYIGSYVGSAIVDSTWSPGSGPLSAWHFPISDASSFASGAVVGSQIGYNFQSGPYVLGVEGDIGAGFLTSQARCLTDWLSVCEAKTDMIATLTGRLGYTFDALLLYAKAGAAFTRDSFTVTGSNYAGEYTGSQFRTGWTVGAGVEMPLTSTLSAKAEYAYLGFGSSDVSLANGFSTSAVPLSSSIQMVKLGLNWRPWGAPLPGNAPALPSPGKDWSGLYGGLHAGGMWGRNEWDNGGGAFTQSVLMGHFPGASAPMGLLGGAQIGYTVQHGPWVAGLEGSISAVHLTSYAQCGINNATRGNFVCENGVNSIGSVSARLGRSMGNVLLYGKVGAAWIDSSSAVYSPAAFGAHEVTGGTRWGWMLGSGVEYALTQKLSAFLEYNFYDFGNQGLTFTHGVEVGTASFRQRLEAVRMGLNYRFAWGQPDQPLATDTASRESLVPAGWTAEIGGRYFASRGRIQKDLMAPDAPSRINSRLIYANSTAHAVETFFRLQHESGLFLKGYAGLGSQFGGSLNDEDFPSEIVYSNTLSDMSDGQLAYGALDVGYDVLRTDGGSLGAFIGYRGMFQGVNGFGCNQLAQDRTCSAVTPNNVVLSETESWQGIAIGFNSRMQLSRKLRLDVDAAYLPYVTRMSRDNHWFRSDINPQAESGRGWGSQIEAVLNYAMTDRLELGLGARYWYYKTDTAYTQFPGFPARSPLTFYSERYGAFLQASYRFGDLPKSVQDEETLPPVTPANWSGVYVGGALGSARGHSSYASPFIPPVSGDATRLGGAIAGGQIGADYQMGAYVIGAEAAFAWANVAGTDTCFSTAPAGAVSGFDCGSTVRSLGSVTGRVGYAFDKALVYARGGFAWNQQQDMFNNYNFTGQIYHNTSTNKGWTLGGGVEYALLPQLSLGLDYKHYDFGASDSFITTAPASLAGVNLAPGNLRMDVVTMTLNYRFNSAGLHN